MERPGVDLLFFRRKNAGFYRRMGNMDGVKKILELSSGGISVDGNRILGPLHFVWRENEHWAVTGPNGCGKSAFLQLISGDLYSKDCDIQYFYETPPGKEPEDLIKTVSLDEQRRLLEILDAYVQMRWNSIDDETTPMLSDWFSQNSVEGVRPGEKRRRNRASETAFSARLNEYLELFGIGHLLNRRVAELSNGELRRSLLVRALMSSPGILLLDAPFTGLDSVGRKLLASNLETLAARGAVHTMTAVVDPEELPAFITHRLIFNAAGDVVYQGPAAGAGFASSDSGNACFESLSGPAQAVFSHLEPVNKEAKAVVEMRDITVAYGSNTVLDKFSWTVREGERWLLTGENGCGKTTLIALIIGDHPQAYSNDIRFFGKKRGGGESIWSVKRRIGWVSPELHSCMDGRVTVLDTVLSGFCDTPYANGVFGRTRIRRARKWLEKFGLDGRRDLAFCELSGGEQQLALLARALVKKPPLIILDEPCQNLDPDNVSRFLSILDEVCAETKATMIYVTHLKNAAPGSVSHTLRLHRESRVS